jgi:colanic acid biosynthesis glycosyl transferase WcaI
MKILVYGLNYAPELIGIGKYTNEMCEWLSARGHHVKVVTGYPFYPHWQVDRRYRNSAYSRELRNGIEVTRCPLYVPARPSGLRRLVSHLSFALSSAPALIGAALRFRPDVVLAIAPSQLTAPAALTASAVSGARSWLHIQDFEIESAFELRILTGNWLRRCAEYVESAMLKRYDRVSTISAKMKERLLGKKVAPGRAVEFRNWVDTRDVTPRDRMTSLRAQLGLNEQALVALYSGSMALKQGLENVIEAARLLHHTGSPIEFVFCGEGISRQRLNEAAKGLDNVRFLELQPKESLPELLATADIHLLPQRAAVADLVLPSKLAAMLASGRPVIAMAETGTQLATEAADCGLVIPADNPDALAAALVRLATDPGLRRELGQSGRRRAVENWDVEKILGELEQHLLSLKRASSQERSGYHEGSGSSSLQMTRAFEIEANPNALVRQSIATRTAHDMRIAKIKAETDAR